MIAYIQNIVIALQSGNAGKAWQEFFSHLGLKGNENVKGEKPISKEVASKIFDAVDSSLELVKEDKVINAVLDGIHNLIPYITEK